MWACTSHNNSGHSIVYQKDIFSCTSQYPLSMYLVAGSQSNLASTNSVVLMKLNKLVALKQSGEDKASDSDSKLHTFHLYRISSQNVIAQSITQHILLLMPKLMTVMALNVTVIVVFDSSF